MKRPVFRTLLVVFGSVLTLAVLLSPGLAGGPSCGSKASASCTGVCTPAACDPCPMPNCCGICGGPAECSWDHTRWHGLSYTTDGALNKELSARQAKKVAHQYLAKIGINDRNMRLVDDDPNYYLVWLTTEGAPPAIEIAKKTGWIRQQGC